jgi:hypothetical protein
MTKRRVKGGGSVYRFRDGRCMREYVDANGHKRYVSGRERSQRYIRSSVSSLRTEIRA